jgi:hypothetical protein
MEVTGYPGQGSLHYLGCQGRRASTEINRFNIDVTPDSSIAVQLPKDSLLVGCAHLVIIRDFHIWTEMADTAAKRQVDIKIKTGRLRW